MRRLLATLAAASLAGLLAAACAAEEPAATVNGREISADELQEELEAIRGNEAYVQAFEQNTQIPVRGQGDGTFSQALLAEVLRVDIIFTLIRQELDERGIEVDDAVREQARQQALCQLAFVGGPGEQCEAIGGPVLEAFPPDYQEELIDRWAAALTLDAALREEGASEEAVQAWFDEHADRYAETCVSHILVGSEQEAADARSRIEEGDDFADVAADLSQDTGTAEQGGELGCSTLTRYLPSFADVAERATVGEVTEPVQTDFGWHLILVTSREDTPSLDDVREEVEQDLAGRSDINGWLDEAIAEAEIAVDARYGTWNEATGQIDPPAGPTTTATTAPPPFPSVTIEQ